MPSYRITTEKTWRETTYDLNEMFNKWGVNYKEWTVYALRPSGRRPNFYSQEERTVIVEFRHPSGQVIRVNKGDQARPEDNLRAIYLALEDLRMIERRGLSDIVRSALIQIEAPKGANIRPKRAPYEVLEVAPSASLEVIDAAYRAKAKMLHPDSGGDADAMRELNEAMDAIKSEMSTRA